MKTQYNLILRKQLYFFSEKHHVVIFNIWLHLKLIKPKTSLLLFYVGVSLGDWKMCNEVDMQLVLFTRKKRDKCVCGPRCKP